MIGKMKVHFSSDTNEWGTPEDLFEKLDLKFNFTLDPCCSIENKKCKKFYTKEDNGLLKSWQNEVVFMNPPYGREIKKWVKKAYEESKNGATIVCLIPARTDTSYWHDYIFGNAEIDFLRGRLKFVNSSKQSNNAPFPSAIVVFYPSEIDE